MEVTKEVIQAERELYIDALDALYELDAILDVLSIKHGINRDDLYDTIDVMFEDIVLKRGV